MALRTVVIDTHCKLEYSLNYFVYRTADEIKRILLDEIHTVIVNTTAASITTDLLCELSTRKIKVVFCDEKANPTSELIPYYGSHDCTKRIIEQTNWSTSIKGRVWSEIIKEKIRNQSKILRKVGKEELSSQLLNYCDEVVFDDKTNREGHAAKVYFNNVFGEGFKRTDNSYINAALNYGYSIILSQFNRTICSSGYLTQIGIHHKSENNQFNFSCDLMEPFRPIVDKIALSTSEKTFKKNMIEITAMEIEINGKKYSFSQAVSIYFNSVINALTHDDINLISFPNDYDL